MSFITDKQTLEDLNIPGKYRPDSVFSLFNKVITRGGERLLNEMFRQPLTDPAAINERAAIFRYFAGQSFPFPFSQDKFHSVEEYLGVAGNSNLIATSVHIYRKKILATVVGDEGYKVLHDQLITTIGLLNIFSGFLHSLSEADLPETYFKQLQDLKKLFTNGCLHWVVKEQGVNKFSAARVVKYDHLLRSVHAKEVRSILEAIYQLDVYLSVSGLAIAEGFTFAQALPKQTNCLSIVNMRHPCIEKAIGNTIIMKNDSNVLFLTGANMAGKSTFMKSFGIAIYLAHMGFPVAADAMTFSVKDGICSSINVPDDLSLGYSHFYAEVQRVKKVAQEISRPLEMVVIFDELFKGTNVKDAYDATLAITEAFAEKKKCFFIISTHITEAGTQLQSYCSNLQFVYLPSILHGNKPMYTYRLQEGISNDRHGMIIIQQEGILKLIEG